MKKILVIASSYCCQNSPNGQIERHFFSNLPAESYHCTILCNEKWNYIVESNNCDIVRTRFNKWIDYACRLMYHTPLHCIGNIPDKEYFCWGKNAITEALKLAENEQFDIIHSISLPCSAHRVAFELKKKLNIPWIAQFYDPWSGNPYRVMRSSRMRNKDLSFEKNVAMNADYIIHPCDAMVDHWKTLYGENIVEKVGVLPFVAEIPNFEVRKRVNDKLVISHIGNFSKNRRADVFIKAISMLNESIKNKIQVNFVGTVESDDIKLIQQYGLENIFKLVGTISEAECYDYYEKSDLFLIIDTDCSPNLFYPSKILKYFRYKKPILGITTEQSVIKDELSKTGNYHFEYNDANGIALFIKRAVDDYESILTNDTDYGEKFSTENVIKEYCNLIDRICR